MTEDTSQEMLLKQFNIIDSFPLSKRIAMLFDLTELSREIIRNRIREAHPNIYESELNAELFKIFYKDDFDSDTLEKISKSILESNLAKK